MTKIVFRMTALMALMTMTAQAKTQDWGGRVIDEKGEPMPFVNVVLLSLPDSAFVQGGMTDEQGIQHDIDLRRMGMLTLDLRCNDVFSSDETKAILYGPREMTVLNPTRRTFMVNLTWKFNEARSKYRGSGAGEKQKARM